VKILIVSQYFWPENFRINDLARELTSRQHQVTVLTGIPNYPDGKVFKDYREHPSKFKEFYGAKVIRSPMFSRGKGSFQLILNYLSFIFGAILWGTYYLRSYRPDVIFVFEPSPVTVGLPAVWLGRIKKSPVVFWALDLWPETLVAVGVVRSPKVLRWIACMVTFIYDRCTLVLGQSRAFLAGIGKYCNDQSKIRYFPSWSEEIFPDQEIIKAPEIPNFKEGFTIVFAGNIGEAQDFPSVLDAAEILKNNTAVRWLIVGDGNKFDWLQSEVLKRGLQEKVFLPGRFPLERMTSIYAHADALLVSLKKSEVFAMTIPGKVQSYLMSGIPILGMLDGEGASVISEAKAGLVCGAGDSAALSKCILDLLALAPADRKVLGVNGRNYAQKEFDRSKLIDKLELLFSEAIRSTNNQKFFK
jgi:glycosyltransferase involved in cell wall biosynthesis